MKVKPLSPKKVKQAASDAIPDFVIKAVNNLLAKECRGDRQYATLRQTDIVAEILRVNPKVKREDIWKYRWLDFEGVFERAGWEVNYDKPGYNESWYEPSFDFKAKR
jgi:hypothetical protein